MTFPELFRLPATVDLTTAANALGIHVQTAYKLLRSNAFPCSVLRLGRRYRVPTRALLLALRIEEIPVQLDDVTTGAAFAARSIES
ncbi:helix-turn-helix protein [Actinocrispum wychmicini]|uniref:Helix-turn-helix protein n=2 Tax=Actinocrispum wychmicini TaxID=1213861 RepID=A0A4R2JIM2_9PSEU|nr:helix-turn-helix protein [Actinocrispum wychmicini]